MTDIDIFTVVTEWRAEILEDSDGNQYMAPFPEGVTRPVYYGIGVKVSSVNMSQYQLIPYNRASAHPMHCVSSLKVSCLISLHDLNSYVFSTIHNTIHFKQ